MKKYILLLIIPLLFSCNDNTERLKKLEEEVKKIEQENKELRIKQDEKKPRKQSELEIRIQEILDL